MIHNEKRSVRFSLPGRQEQCYDKIDLSEIFRKIQDKEPLCLNRVALEGFSANAYREYYHLPADEMIEIWIDSITDCLFLEKDGNAFDLSYCRLSSPDPVAGVSLEDNIFYKGKVGFSCSRIDEVDLSLTGSSFWDTELDLNILVREYRCSGGTETANPAAGNRHSGTGIPHLIETYFEFTRLKLDLNHIPPA